MRFPGRALIKPLILDVLADGHGHTTDLSQKTIGEQLGLDDVQLAVRLRNGHRAFQNEHAFALNELMSGGLIQHDGRRAGSQVYKITRLGQTVARGSMTLAGEERRTLWKEVTPQEAARARDEVVAKRRKGGRPQVSPKLDQNERRGTDATETAPQPPSDDEHDYGEAPQSRVIIGGQTELEGYEYWQAEFRVRAEQRELALVARFRRFLEEIGRQCRQEKLLVGTTWITYDLLDTSRNILFEAKADSLAREQVRMAVGQLFDYGYHGFECARRPIAKAVLLPAAPADDIAELLGYLEIGIAYELEEGEFVEDYPWE